MKIPLSKTLVIFSVGLSALPVIVIGVLVWMMNLDVREIVYSEFDKIGARTTRQIVDDTIRICKIIQRTQLDEDERAHGAIETHIGALGVPRLLEKKGEIRAASQMTPTETSDFNVPVMLFGDSPVKLKLASDGTIADASGKVRDTLDLLKRETGLDFCILQRIGTSGAMLRIASTATDPDGQPYVGTYIPATGGYDDGAIVRTLLARKTFSGISRTGSMSFIANYEPLLDSYGDVVGAIGYGRPQSSIGFLLKYFENIRIGTMGSVWAVELVGRGESVVRVSRDGKRNGYIVEGDTFKKRREMTLEIINSAVAQGDKVAVRFNPSNPSQVVEAEGSRQLRGAAAGIIFGLIFAGASAFIALRVSRGLSAAPVLGAAAAAVLILALSLFLMRGRIAQALPAADEAALVHSGGLLLELPDLKPYTGRVRVRGASGDVRVVRYKDGKPVEAPPVKP